MVSIYTLFAIWLKMEMELPPPSHGFNVYFVYYLAKDGDGITNKRNDFNAYSFFITNQKDYFFDSFAVLFLSTPKPIANVHPD